MKDRRNAIQLAFLSLLLGGVGCRARRRFDPAPERGFLEDRWSGFQFTKLTSSFTLPLVNPGPSLSRSTRSSVPVVTSDGDQIANLSQDSTIRPSLAMVDLGFDATSTEEPSIAVKLRWPDSGTTFQKRTRYREETKSTAFQFDDMRRFIDGSKRFRCDDQECYFSPQKYKSPQQSAVQEINVSFLISGPNPDSKYELRFDYPETAILWKLAKQVYPEIG